MKFNFLNFMSALVKTEQAALTIPVVALSPAGKVISLALVGEELAVAFAQALHAENSVATGAVPAPAANGVVTPGK